MDGESDERRPQQNSPDANFVAVRRGMLQRRSSMRKCHCARAVRRNHLPMQKRAKTASRISSVTASPLISPSAAEASTRSGAIKSTG